MWAFFSACRVHVGIFDQINMTLWMCDTAFIFQITPISVNGLQKCNRNPAHAMRHSTCYSFLCVSMSNDLLYRNLTYGKKCFRTIVVDTNLGLFEWQVDLNSNFSSANWLANCFNCNSTESFYMSKIEVGNFSLSLELHSFDLSFIWRLQLRFILMK